MNSMSVLLLGLLTVCVLSLPADESVSKSRSRTRDVEEVESDVKVEAEKKTGTKAVSHPTVKCEHIYLGNMGKGVEIEEKRDENHVCFSHCVTLGGEYREGKCEGGLCHCEREVSPPRGNPDRVPTVKCSDLVSEEGETRTDKEEACKIHCKSLGGNFDEGKCAGGFCTCRIFQ